MINYSKIYSQKAFTLIETMVTVLIVLIIFSSVFGIYIRGVLFWHNGHAKSEVTESLRIGMDRLSRELRQSSKLFVIENNSIKFYDNQNKLITYFIYNNNQLNRKISGNSNSMPVVNNVVGLDAVYNENAHLVSITLTGKNTRTKRISISTSICLRALTDN